MFLSQGENLGYFLGLIRRTVVEKKLWERFFLFFFFSDTLWIWLNLIKSISYQVALSFRWKFRALFYKVRQSNKSKFKCYISSLEFYSVFWNGCKYSFFHVVVCCLVTKLCPTLCEPMDCSMPGSPVLHYLLDFAQIHIHWASDVIYPSHPLLTPSPPALNLFPKSGSFPMNWLFTSSAQSIGTLLQC